MTYVTAGYPKAESTPDILLALEKGGAGTVLTARDHGEMWQDTDLS